MSRIRNTEYNTVHHLTSRIAHKAFFLKEEECKDLLSLILRVSAFSGIKPLGWCIMSNHFHLYVYLPHPPALSEAEILRRYALLKGKDPQQLGVEMNAETGAECQTPRASSDDRAQARAALVKSIRRRMYSITEYMRMIKKWFSDDYNERNGHKGTMWEAVYGDSNVFFLPESSDDYVDLRDRLAYIHLNPIRAAMATGFAEYPWSSYTAYRNGNKEAVAAMHLAYPHLPDEEIVTIHEQRMMKLLETWKHKRAEEIARKRVAGYTPSPHSLTDECMVAQARERIERAQKLVIELQLERDVTKGTRKTHQLICQQIVAIASAYPSITAQGLAHTLKVPLRSIQRYLAELSERGQIAKSEKNCAVRAA